MIINDNARLRNHRLSTAGQTFSIPYQTDFTAGGTSSWSITDLSVGEFGIQIQDGYFAICYTQSIATFSSHGIGVQGPQGNTGSNGLNGATGSQGSTGPQGLQGATGSDNSLTYSYIGYGSSVNTLTGDTHLFYEGNGNTLQYNDSNNAPIFQLAGGFSQGDIFIGDYLNHYYNTYIMVQSQGNVLFIRSSGWINFDTPTIIANGVTYSLPTHFGITGSILTDTTGNGDLSWQSNTGTYSETTFTLQTSIDVTHNFGRYPNVQVIDVTGAVFYPLSIINNTVNDFTVSFTGATSGTIIAV